MDKEVEHEFRNDIKQINEKMSKLQTSFNDKLTAIEVAIANITAKQNMGAWVFQLLITVIVGGFGGFITTHFPK